MTTTLNSSADEKMAPLIAAYRVDVDAAWDKLMAGVCALLVAEARRHEEAKEDDTRLLAGEAASLLQPLDDRLRQRAEDEAFFDWRHVQRYDQLLLDIGGQLFHTSVPTLRRVRMSMFYGQFKGTGRGGGAVRSVDGQRE
jgi:hypothetical protein